MVSRQTFLSPLFPDKFMLLGTFVGLGTLMRLGTLMWLSTLILLGTAVPTWADDGLTVEPSHTELYETDTLTLTVKSTLKLEFDLGDLFNFDIADMPMPDVEKLEPEFEILSRNQQYSIHSSNNEMYSDITWTFQLAPKKTGTLVIPPLTVKGKTSEPVEITVREGSSPATAGAPRDVFIELAADKDQVYVQEQLVLTVRLYFTGNLLRGELSEPAHPDTVIESLGQQREYKRFRGDQEYRVVERRYAVFPQQPGILDFEPFRFEGQTRDARGKVRFLRDSAELFEIPVKAPPASFSGDTWLPASELTLEESGLSDGMTIDQGQNLTRTVTLAARGLTAEALPPLPMATPDSLRSYPEQPERETQTLREGLRGTLTQNSALVGVSAGSVTLPELRIPWWDVTTDSERVAVIPARTINIRPDAGAIASTAPTQPTPTSTQDGNGDAVATTANNATVWPWLSLLLGAGWLMTLILWLRSRNATRTQPATPGVREANEKATFEILLAAAERGQANTPNLMLNWWHHRGTGRRCNTLAELQGQLDDSELVAELRRLQNHHYGRRDVTGNGVPWDGSRLVAALKRLRQTSPATIDASDLPPLYPASLSSRS